MDNDDGKNNEAEEREKDVQRWSCQKALNALLITHALNNIPDHFTIKKRNRKLHQFDQEICQNGNVDPCVDV